MLLRIFVSAVLLPVVLFLQVGCSSMSKHETESAVSTPINTQKLNAHQTYLIMVAELFQIKKEHGAAFEIFYEVADQTQSPEVAERAFEISMHTYNSSMIQKATDLHKRLSPKSESAWKSAYLLSVSRGDTDLAIDEWQQYRALSSEPLETLLLTTSIQVTQATSADHGLAFLMKLATRYSKEDVVHYGVGISAASFEKNDLAISALEEANYRYEKRIAKEVDLVPIESGFEPIEPNAEVEQMMRDLKIYKDIQHQLADLYLKINLYREGLDKLANYAREAKNDWAFQERYARLEVKIEDYEAAEVRYQRILDNKPKAHTSRFAIALLRLEAKDYEVADEHLQLLKQTNGYKSLANYYYGVSLQEQEKYQAARVEFDLVSVGSHWVDAQLHLAELDALETSVDAAVERLDQALAKLSHNDRLEGAEISKRKLRLIRGKGMLLHQANELKSAIDAYNQGLEISPNHVSILLSQSMAFYDLKQFDNYERNLKQVLVLRPNHVEALNALGYFYVEDSPNLEKAEPLLNKAHALSPNEYYILDSLGWLAFHKQDYSVAEAYLEKAYNIQLDGEVLYHLFRVKVKLSKQAEIRSLWQKHRAALKQDANYKKLMRFINQLPQ